MSLNPEHPDLYFYRAWRNFSANLGALHVFSTHVTSISDQVDKDLIYRTSVSLARILDDDTEEIQADFQRFVPSLNEAHIYPDVREDADAKEIIAALQDSAFKERLVKWITQNPLKGYKLLEILWDMFYQPPANGILLRRSAFIQLFGVLDVLFHALFVGYYKYQDLGEVPGSAAHEEKARKKAKRQNSSKKGWLGKIANFEELGVDISPMRPYLDEFAEMAQRRNLLVHKDGAIDEQYMKFASPEFRPTEAEQGCIFLVPTTYLQRAIHVTTVIGFWLTQASWRTWNQRKNLKNAHKAAYETIYQTLRRGDYDLTIELAQVMNLLSIPKRHKSYRHYILVNQAIAFRELGKISKMRHIISRLRKTKHEWQFDIALAILQENFPEAQRFLIAAKRERRLHSISPYWPLFDPVRDNKWFKNLFVMADMGELPPSSG